MIRLLLWLSEWTNRLSWLHLRATSDHIEKTGPLRPLCRYLFLIGQLLDFAKHRNFVVILLLRIEAIQSTVRVLLLSLRLNDRSFDIVELGERILCRGSTTSESSAAESDLVGIGALSLLFWLFSCSLPSP